MPHWKMRAKLAKLGIGGAILKLNHDADLGVMVRARSIYSDDE